MIGGIILAVWGGGLVGFVAGAAFHACFSALRPPSPRPRAAGPAWLRTLAGTVPAGDVGRN